MGNLKAMVHLPKCVALKATYGDAPFKYLGVEDDGKLAYSTDKVVSEQAKFAVESAGNGIAHIRSCFNNKYWVRSSESENWIVAAAKDPVEDKTAWNCTLFRANVSDDGKTVKFVHVQLGKNVGRRDIASDRDMYLCLEPLATAEDVSTVVDYGTIVVLPRYIALKDQNGFFLNTFEFLTSIHFVLFMNKDVGQTGNVLEIFTTRDGHIYLKSVTLGLFWRTKSPSHDPAIEGVTTCTKEYEDEENDPTDTDMLFSVASVAKGIVALRHLNTNKFLERIEGSQRKGSIVEPIYCLNRTSNTITNEAVHLRVVEPIVKREVNVFEFHLDRARIYSRKPLTSSWAVSTSVSISSGIPVIGEISIEIGAEYSEQYDMGGSVEESEQVQSTFTVKVPPKKKATVSAIATRGKCDVPYSYDQVDHMPNGDIKRTTMSDGVYTGVNAYNFSSRVRYEPL
uniref:Agglutinin domain-containing protein n=1 Tax=Chenopodium quinoa TaxID=63459 RepID=A0A803LTD8_CHEQI